MPACRTGRQTHECRLKLAAAGEHLSIVRVAIYVAYLRPGYSAMQHKESIPKHLYTSKEFIFIYLFLC